MRKIKKAMSVPHIWMYLVPLCIVLISCRFFQINIQALEQMRGEEIGLSVADYVVEFYKGELPMRGLRSSHLIFRHCGPCISSIFSRSRVRGSAAASLSTSSRSCCGKRQGDIGGCHAWAVFFWNQPYFLRFLFWASLYSAFFQALR